MHLSAADETRPVNKSLSMEGSRAPVPRAEKSEEEEEEKWVNKDKRDEVMISREWMEEKQSEEATERKAELKKIRSGWSHVQSQGKLLGHAQVRRKPALSGGFP